MKTSTSSWANLTEMKHGALSKELSIETMELIVKFVEEGNPLWSIAKGIVSSQSAVSKICWKFKWNG